LLNNKSAQWVEQQSGESVVAVKNWLRVLLKLNVHVIGAG
jgi:hypothetical protein